MQTVTTSVRLSSMAHNFKVPVLWSIKNQFYASIQINNPGCDDFDCNSGTCSDDSGYPVCTCPDDVYGENCQILNGKSG